MRLNSKIQGLVLASSIFSSSLGLVGCANISSFLRGTQEEKKEDDKKEPWHKSTLFYIIAGSALATGLGFLGNYIYKEVKEKERKFYPINPFIQKESEIEYGGGPGEEGSGGR